MSPFENGDDTRNNLGQRPEHLDAKEQWESIPDDHFLTPDEALMAKEEAELDKNPENEEDHLEQISKNL